MPQDASEVTTRSLRRGLVALSEIETPADAVMTMARRASGDGESRRAVLLYGAASGLAEILDSRDQKDQWANEARRFTDGMDDDIFTETVEQARNAIVEAASPVRRRRKCRFDPKPAPLSTRMLGRACESMALEATRLIVHWVISGAPP